MLVQGELFCPAGDCGCSKGEPSHWQSRNLWVASEEPTVHCDTSARTGYLVSTWSIASKTSMLVSELWVQCIFHPLEKNPVKDLVRQWQEQKYQVHVIIRVPQITCLWQLKKDAFFPFLRNVLPPISSLCKMLKAVSASALMASAGISSGHAAFPFLSLVIAPYLCLRWRVAVDRVVCNGWLYVGRCSWCWSIQLLSKVFYPSLQLMWERCCFCPSLACLSAGTC